MLDREHLLKVHEILVSVVVFTYLLTPEFIELKCDVAPFVDHFDDYAFPENCRDINWRYLEKNLVDPKLRNYTAEIKELCNPDGSFTSYDTLRWTIFVGLTALLGLACVLLADRRITMVVLSWACCGVAVVYRLSLLWCRDEPCCYFGRVTGAIHAFIAFYFVLAAVQTLQAFVPFCQRDEHTKKSSEKFKKRVDKTLTKFKSRRSRVNSRSDLSAKVLADILPKSVGNREQYVNRSDHETEEAESFREISSDSSGSDEQVSVKVDQDDGSS